MSMELTITDAGRAAIIDAQNAGFSRVLIDAVAFGSAAYQPSAAATQLTSEIKRISGISGGQTDTDIIHLTAVDNSTDQYTVREIGFYTDTGVLLGLYSAPDTLIIEKSAVSSLFVAFDLTLQPDDAAVITFGNTDFLLPSATDSTEGAMRFANTAERLALTANNVAMTPAGVKQAINAETAAAAVKLSTARTFKTTGDATGSASSDLLNGVSISLTLSNTGVQAGSYRQVTVDAKGRITGGSNPTTLAGYGITDAVPSGRTITAGTGLSGGGSLAANRTLDVLYGTTAGTAAQGNDSRIVNAIQASQKGVAGGVSTLDSNVKIPLNQIPDSIIGQVEYMGTWNAASNVPGLPTTPAEKGHYYVVTTGGTRFGHTFAVGDWCISDGSKWDKVDNTDAVSSVNGRTGVVTGLVEATDSRLTNSREWTAETVSQAEAEAGSSTTRRAWSALRIKQAIAALTSAAATKLASARTLTIGASGKSFDGSGNVSWTLAEIGAAAASHTHSSSTVSSITPSVAGAATAGLSVGAVGSYALLFNSVAEYLSPGAIKSGSYLRYASTFSADGNYYGGGSITPPGTWRCMGADGARSGSNTYTDNNSSTTLWLRIS